MKTNGFTPDQVAAVLVRDGSICAMWGSITGCRRQATTANHRRNRQMGGSQLRNGMSNACAICDFCNDAIERDASDAAEARALGVKLEEGDIPSRTLMFSPFFSQWVQLTDASLLFTGGRNPFMRPDFLPDEDAA